MSACKSYQRQLALLSVAALNDTEKATALEHLNQCPACQAYANQLQGIVGLYTQDAQRAIAPLGARTPPRRAQTRWIEWLAPKPALVALAIVVMVAATFLFRTVPKTDSPPARAATVVSPAPSIANSRHLADQDLEELLETDIPARSSGSEFVFSVRTRQE